MISEYRRHRCERDALPTELYPRKIDNRSWSVETIEANASQASELVDLTDRSEGETETVSHCRFDYSHNCHFQPGCPPRAQRDQRFHRTDEKVSEDANRERGDDRANSAHEKERNDRDECADRSGDRGR